MRRTLAALLGIVVLAGAACAGGDLTGGRRTVGGVTLTFSAEPARVQLGQPVRLTLRLSNNSGVTQELTYPSAQRYDFWVTSDGAEVWRWSDDMAFAQEVTHESIPGQGREHFSERWTAETSGTYQVHGIVHAQGFGDELSGEVVVR